MIMKPTTERLVDAYLKQLDSELADLPGLRRKEIVEEISEHIAEARAASPSQGEAEIRTLLDRLGDPAEIASEAKERFGVQPRKSRALEIATLLLLLVGGVVLPVIGWLIGVVLLWVSDAWDSRDKLIGTLVVPGGLLLPLALLTIGTSAGGACSTPVPAAGAREAAACIDGSGGINVLSLIAVTVLLLAPLVTTAYLARRMRRPPATAL
jgi:uncharacterized membrane protein